MKSKSALRAAILLGPSAALLTAPSAQAATYYWDGTLTGGTGDGLSQGGTATWDTSILNWDQGSGLARIVWPNDTTLGNTDTAGFRGTAGTVPLGIGGIAIDSSAGDGDS
jgi:hypothetical protein